MAQNNVIPTSKINAAAQGNTALKELLVAMANTTNLQQSVTNTAGKNVPPQAKSTVSYLKGTYTVEIQNPGTVSPTSALQAAQATGGNGPVQNVAITAIYHQIRCATSPQFNVGSDVQTFGGTTGSTQTNWTLASLPTGKFYFQVRSSYDGASWNLWRNTNGGQAITQGSVGVTIDGQSNAVWGTFTLPGGQLVSIGSGLAANGGSFGIADGLYSSAMQMIAGPNGYEEQFDHLAHGIIADVIQVVEPNTPQALTGPPSYPTRISMLYKDGEGHTWPGSANVFGLAYDPLGPNVTVAKTNDGNWVDFILPGGAHLTIGTGVTADGATVVPPPEMTWVDASRVLGIVSPAVGFSTDSQAHGIADSRLENMVMRCGFGDGGGRWSATGNWLLWAWSPGLQVENVTGGRFLVLQLPGVKIALGAGVVNSDSPFGLPAGFTPDQVLSIATPASFFDSGHPMSGVYACGIRGVVPSLLYTDTQGNGWHGAVNWLVFAWV